MMDLEVAVVLSIDGNDAVKSALRNDSIPPCQRPNVLYGHIVHHNSVGASGDRPFFRGLHAHNPGDKGYCSKGKRLFLHLVCFDQEIVFGEHTVNEVLLPLALQSDFNPLVHK